MDFYTDPWAGDVSNSPLTDSYSSWTPEIIAGNTPDYMNTASYTTASTPLADTASSSPFVSSSYELPSMSGSKILSGLQNLTDWGLKVSGTIFAANNAAKDQQLNNYLKKAQVDIFQTQAMSAQKVAGLNAQTQANLANMRINAANTAAVGANLGTAMGNNSLMLWLTVAGVVFAFIQVVNSAK